MKNYDVIIVGAGAAGMMCAIKAGSRKRRVLILEHSNKPGKKILMSGGGYCNFTNYYIAPERYLSHNPHFCRSALSRYTQWDFIHLVESHDIRYHEKSQGELFCDNKARVLVDMLLKECEQVGVEIALNTSITSIKKSETGFDLVTDKGQFKTQAVVVASGGLSIPTLGASPFGYQLAEQFGIVI